MNNAGGNAQVRKVVTNNSSGVSGCQREGGWTRLRISIRPRQRVTSGTWSVSALAILRASANSATGVGKIMSTILKHFWKDLGALVCVSTRRRFIVCTLCRSHQFLVFTITHHRSAAVVVTSFSKVSSSSHRSSSCGRYIKDRSNKVPLLTYHQQAYSERSSVYPISLL